ncbi:hypothetical protein K443DRAFT_617632 [Laccaria amethystina LaAM-08-1]|uniref:Uncharacterized protein n=1 Tax=Laccaria amethystina LaAM-08-1 TaxID=1095629 RepID=A0A0C9XEX3_9AGAR|nr:hypothetical protein K443DRAFT_617632 [Laccaria amethystina LaAM-08-1]
MFAYKDELFFYKFSVFEISCIQVYSEVLSKVTPRKHEREWQDSINWNEKCIYPAPTQNAGARVMPLSWCLDAVVSSSSSLTQFPSSPYLLLLPVVPGLPAPRFHPANGCSRRGVQWWWW